MTVVAYHGFNSARASHDIALINELTARGIEVSAIYNNGRISFTKKVVLDKESARLIIQEQPQTEITHINNKSVFTSALVDTDFSIPPNISPN